MTVEPYYQDELVTLYLGDCADILPEVSADVVCTSPPYNMGLTPGGNGRGMYRPSGSRKGGRFRQGYPAHDDAMPHRDYLAWQRAVLQMCWDATPSHGAVFYNHRVRVVHGRAQLPLDMDFGIPLRQIVTWDRGTGIGVNVRHYCSVAEWILLFAKPDFRLVDHGASGVGDVWRLGMANKREVRHPAPFPESLPARVLATTGAASILDPFVGSGTTLVAAQQMGRTAIGIDNSEAYCEIAATRCAALRERAS